MRTPSVNCSRFEIVNSATIAEKPACPNASTASGRPMLPQLLNIIGRHERAVVDLQHARDRPREQARAEHDADAASDQQPFAARSNSLLASAEKMSAGPRMFMLTPIDLAPCPGCTRRAYR